MPWTSNVKIPNQKSKASPAMAFFVGGLTWCTWGIAPMIFGIPPFDGTVGHHVKIPRPKAKRPLPWRLLAADSIWCTWGVSDIWHSTFGRNPLDTQRQNPGQK